MRNKSHKPGNRYTGHRRAMWVRPGRRVLVPPPADHDGSGSEEDGVMKTKKRSVFLILPAVAACCWHGHITRAQDPELPPLPTAGVVIPLEHDTSRAAPPLPALP